MVEALRTRASTNPDRVSQLACIRKDLTGTKCSVKYSVNTLPRGSLPLFREVRNFYPGIL